MQRTSASKEVESMTIEQNKALVRRVIDEVFVKNSADAVDELVATDFVPHSWPGVGPGREPLKQAQQRISMGLADVSMAIEDVIGEDDKVVVRLSSHARQVGEFMGMPASGKEYTIPEIHIFRIRDGMVAEHWLQMDTLGLMTQLGALPTPMKKAS
jgi:predicted SnoaL-like aldol condensation-catalyzing enzyme